MRRTLLSAAVIAIVGTAFAVASPASAANVSSTLTCNGNNLLTRSPLSSLQAAINDDILVTNNSGGTVTVVVTGATGNAAIPSGASTPFRVTATSGSIQATSAGGSCNGTATSINFAASGGGNTDDGGASSSEPAPVQETLSLAVSTANTSCTVGNPTGYSGSWLYLPKADECSQTGPSARSDAKLLGWATSSIFPRAVAQAQVDKKWGAIDDTFYGMRMIFIPAGMATFVSGSNQLFPIWDR